MRLANYGEELHHWTNFKDNLTSVVKNLIPHFIQEQWLAKHRKGDFDAYTMFVDMSGFTHLTETLLSQGREGAERLSNILNAIFAPMVHTVYQHGGFIPYFAGDAFIGLFEKEDCNCSCDEILALAQHQLFLLERASEQFPEFKIGIKVGLSVGRVEWGIVGKGPYQFYFRGEAIEGCVQSQELALEQQVIADEPFFASLRKNDCLTKLADKPYYQLATEASLKFPHPSGKHRLPELKREVAELFLPDAVIDLNQEGEFRTVVAVFLNFSELEDYDVLNEFSTHVIEEVYDFSGYFKEIDYSDKGPVMVILFGAPIAFENNVERALEFVSSLQEKLIPLQMRCGLNFRIGMASGIAYAGIVGGEERCQYAAVGDRINIAARAMMRADWGEVLVDSEVQKSRQFQFKFKGNLTYKGLQQRVPTYQLIGKNPDQSPSFEGKIIGREKELEDTKQAIRKILAGGTGGILKVLGEAGIGKTRFLYDLKRQLADELRMIWLSCQCDQILRKPFNPFRNYLKKYFGHSANATEEQNQEIFNERFDKLIDDVINQEQPKALEIGKELVRTKPVFQALIGLKTASSFWDNLDAKGRYQNTIDAIVNFFLAHSLKSPVVLEVEDAQWIDESSKDLLNSLVRKLPSHQLILLISSRFDNEGSEPEILSEELVEKQTLPVHSIRLNPLCEEDVSKLLCQRLNADAHPHLVNMLCRTSNGNPFYVEQILEYFLETGQLEKTEQGWNVTNENINVSNSVQAILTARIDQLSNLVKETIKAAAVIGREFELPVLNEVMQQNRELIRQNGNTNRLLQEQIKTAERAQIWQTTSELRYIFRHSLLREAVYDMQLKTRIKSLHKLIAQAIEKVHAEKLEDKYVDLVFHYEQAGVPSKLRLYLEKAADRARDYYQNQQALRYYTKLADLLQKDNDSAAVARVLLKKAEVLELIGQWADCEDVCRQALSASQSAGNDTLIGQSYYRLGHLLMLKGNYDQANSHLQYAAVFFDASGNDEGMAQVYGDLGNLNFRQGRYDDAKLYFIRSIQLSQKHPHHRATANIVATLGLTYMNIGKYDDGIRWQQSQLEVCKRLNDRQGMAILYVNQGIVYSEKGDYDNALACLQKGLALCEELGNKQLTSIAIGHIGIVFQRRGRFDLAMQHFESDLRITEELGDKQGISIALGLIGELHSVMGNFDAALHYLGRNLQLARELGYKKGIAKALNTIGDVYYFKRDFEKSIEYYDQAIAETRSIDSKLVLGFSLVEKGRVLLAMEDLEGTKKLLDEAFDIAWKLNQPELIDEAEMLKAMLHIASGEHEKAREILNELLQNEPEPAKEAAIHFYLSLIEEGTEHCQKALERYQKLYEHTPMYLYKLRIDTLRSKLS
ncbi:MAG: adenylate/guanylate cyclase domain-containing protein [Saprospirales bacterium]|nr:adenylate/guanylate cyclase domain-containing protein [Saprospirales bacterium]